MADDKRSELSVGVVCDAHPATVATLESAGVDSLWVGGHVASTNPTPEAMVQLARLSALAERARIGTSILLLPLYPPAIVAKQIADLDRMTGGRITVGVGVGGEHPGEFRACGIPIDERGPRTDEAIDVVRMLWSGEQRSPAGPYYPMQDVRIHPAPTQPGGPPIVVAGRQPVAMRRAATRGDGWMPYLYSARRYRESVRAIRAIADGAGRDLIGFEWLAFVFVNVDTDHVRARREAAGFLGGNYRQDFDAMLDRVAVAGDADHVLGGLTALVDAGARHLVIAPATRQDRSTVLEPLFEDVIPRLRAHPC